MGSLGMFSGKLRDMFKFETRVVPNGIPLGLNEPEKLRLMNHA